MKSLSLVEELLHPTKGLLRGIIDRDEQGKGGRDPDDKLISISIGELRKADRAIRQLAEQTAFGMGGKL